MERDEIQAVVMGTLGGTFYGLIMCLAEVNGMDIFLEIMKYLAAAVFGSIIMAFINRKGQIDKNTDAVNRLMKQMGVSEEETVRHELKGQYNEIIKSIGRGEKETLTEQHNNITKSIEASFNSIAKRYQDEDNTYKLFTVQQRDLKETFDNFSKDYAERIKREKELSWENTSLREENEKLQEANVKLVEENQKLRNELYVIRSRDEPEMDR